jgi:hypothetical protein
VDVRNELERVPVIFVPTAATNDSEASSSETFVYIHAYVAT